MANAEHIAILNQGIPSRNKWRAENPNIRPDLGAANLAEAHYTSGWHDEADLRGVDFYLANLEEANLIHANLERALLVYTDLGKSKPQRLSHLWNIRLGV